MRSKPVWLYPGSTLVRPVHRTGPLTRSLQVRTHSANAESHTIDSAKTNNFRSLSMSQETCRQTQVANQTLA